MITFKDFFSFKKNGVFWLNLLAMVVVFVGAAYAALAWLDIYTQHGKAVEVPHVKDMNAILATKELEKSKLKAIIIDSTFVKNLPAGSVLDQKPEGGARVKTGRTVYLTINANSAPKVAVPDIMDNSSLRQAEARLRALGFKLTKHEYIEGEKDWIYSVTYNGRELHAGEKIPHESTLTLHVGSDKLMNDSTQNDSIITTEITNDEPVMDESWF